jgi:Xaa-Pro dipeptidase
MQYTTDESSFSFPVNGKFSDNQLLVYNAVLDAQIDVIEAIRPGVSWQDMHRTAERAVLGALQKGGLLTDDASIEEMIDADLGAIFMPHGLGHLIGLDTHDVGGYTEGTTPERSSRPGLSNLRTARTLEAGMVLTVEPGCYFIDVLLDLALANPKQARFLNPERLDEFRGSGGVRLEDDVVVTEDGCENLTVCPRAVSEVLDVMSGKPWPPPTDVLPELRRNWVRNDDGKLVRYKLKAASD